LLCVNFQQGIIRVLQNYSYRTSVLLFSLIMWVICIDCQACNSVSLWMQYQHQVDRFSQFNSITAVCWSRSNN